MQRFHVAAHKVRVLPAPPECLDKWQNERHKGLALMNKPLKYVHFCLCYIVRSI